MKKLQVKKLALPLILLILVCLLVFFQAPLHWEIILATVAIFLFSIFFLIKFFLPVKYAFVIASFFLVLLTLGFFRILDLVNSLLLVSLLVGSIILIR